MDPDFSRGKHGTFQGYENQSVRTYKVRDANGTRTITEKTIIKPDGTKVTTREESTEGNTSLSTFGNNNNFDDRFKNMMKDFPSDFQNMGFSRGRGIEPCDGPVPSRSHEGPKPNASASAAADPNVDDEDSDDDDDSTQSGKEPSLKQFRKDALKAHNDRRKKHGVPTLKLSSQLNKYAQKWADHLVKTNSFQHSDCTLGKDRLGENIANKWSSSGADYTGEEVTEQWYSEIKKHDFKSERSSGTGHFTQVVWKDTKELGIGKAKSANGKVIVVGSYRPAGNFIGQFTKNVFPPKH